MTSIRQGIMAALKTAIQAANGLSPYHYSLSNTIIGALNLQEETPPVVLIDRAVETYSDVSPLNLLHRKLQIQITAFVDDPNKAADVAADDLLADLERSILADSSLAGTVIDTTLVSNEVFEDETRTPRVGVILTLEVSYRTGFTNPDTLS